ncbi:MAG: M23 family metallopeptidase, partial [Corynebacterium marinum]|nr:M23 family metallopeptidase [Corynebacterium marinum]
MLNNTQRSTAARHRRISTAQATRKRFALVALTAGAVSSAGVGGAAAATLQASPEPSPQAVDVDYQLTSDADQSPAVAASPQILEITEYKPVANIDEQLDKAVAFSAERAAAAQAEAEEAAAAAAAAAQAAAAPAAPAQAAQTASGGVVSPAQGTFTSGYGMRWGTLHAGIDIANAIGTPILAIMDGTVIDSGPASGYGNWIRIQHSDGSVSVYGHMSTLAV